MSDNNYGAALLAMGMREQQGARWLAWPPEGTCQGWYASSGVVVNPPMGPLCVESRRKEAIAYLRERKLYALDIKQPRIPPKERPQTVLDKWMKERHK